MRSSKHVAVGVAQRLTGGWSYSLKGTSQGMHGVIRGDRVRWGKWKTSVFIASISHYSQQTALQIPNCVSF